MIKRKAAMLDSRRKSSYKHKASSYWLDDQVGASDHLWIPSSSSHDTECYISDKGCEHIGEKRRCAACHMVVHYACVTRLREV
ncbi:hypothetical protein AB6A40_011699 [Gnathostoma spinigerum]|uniref:Phorbol-ester/DAG-type domain-containing protein n=1 Tax=Gnathostoma spinigerum TaxID=75299 RepID=A0ABD6F4Z1_9BILA